MTPMRIDLIAGARPNFMKIAPIIRAIKKAQHEGAELSYRLIHTGQHYDRNMSGSFFEQLNIPAPDVNLGAGGGTQAQQTASIMIGYEEVLMQGQSDLCIVVGDVTSTMACAITARKLHVPVAHVEGGIRSHDWTMPEEINRVVTDSISNYFFTTSRLAGENLRRAGIGNDQIFFVGNTMIDTLLANRERLQQPDFWGAKGLSDGKYLVMTMHRPANVDEEQTLGHMLQQIIDNSRGLPIVFPVHPRTAKVIGRLGETAANLHIVPPMGYLQFIYLVERAKAVITDSGGITEETTVLGVPCMTLRDNTERPETIEVGTNELLGTHPDAIGPALNELFEGHWKKGQIPEKWDGQAADRIVAILRDMVSTTTSS